MCDPRCAQIGGAIICFGGPFYEIEVRGKTWIFEMPPYCGLCPTNKDGSARLSPWPKYVWDAVSEWSAQGRRVDADGMCILGEPNTPDSRLKDTE